jgi:peptidoglycan/LPS O-acetylase OafA/YrhL
MLVYYALFAILHKTIGDDRLLLVILLIFAAGGLARIQTGFIAWRFFYYYLVFAAGFLLSLARLLVRAGLKIPLVNQIAAASFFAYLLHRPIWEIALRIYEPQPITSLSIYLIVIGYLVVLPVAYYAQKIYTHVTRSMLSGARVASAGD